MDDILFDNSLLFETDIPVSVNAIESYSFDGPNFDYSQTNGGGNTNGDLTSETIITIEKRYIERVNELSIFNP